MDSVKIPAFPLNQYVKFIWLYENSANSTKNEIQTFVVEGCPIIIFHYKQALKCKTGNNDWAIHPQQCVIGQIKNFGEIVESGNEGMVAIVFYPDGLSHFLKIPLTEITGLIVDLQCFFGKTILEVQEKICGAQTAESKISVVEQFFLHEIKKEFKGNANEIRYAISQMHANNKTSISELSVQVNMSRRNFERRFIENVGLTPVFYNRIVRFQKVLKLLVRENNRSFTELAYQAGYFDQSHFIRDFRQFYGQPPKSFDPGKNFG